MLVSWVILIEVDTVSFLPTTLRIIELDRFFHETVKIISAMSCADFVVSYAVKAHLTRRLHQYLAIQNLL